MGRRAVALPMLLCLIASGAAPGDALADDGPAGEPLMELVDAAAQRLQTADPVAATKWLSGAPVTDPARVAQVLGSMARDAEAQGLPAEYARTVFGDQIDANEAIQYSRFSWWKLDPAAAPAAAPDLEESRARIDALNQQIVTELAQQWQLLHSPECPVRLDAAEAAVAGARQLDPLYRQALDAATRSYCSP